MELLHFSLFAWMVPLAAIPVLLHLLTLHRLRTVELSTFRFLFDSYIQQRRLRGTRHIVGWCSCW